MNLFEEVTFLRSNKDKWLFVLFIGFYSFGFLTFFQPFGINNHDPEFSINFHFLIATFSVAIVIMISLICSEFFLRTWLMSSWSLIHVLIWYVLVSLYCASISFIFYNFLGDWHDWIWKSYFNFLVDVPAMLLIPTSGLILYFIYRETNKKLRLERGKNPSVLINLLSDNGKNQLSLSLDNLLYIESEENYVAVHFMERKTLKMVLLRSTMKSMEKQLLETPVQRCHRSFIINQTKVIKHMRRSGSETVLLDSMDREIPISEKYAGRLAKLRKE